MVLNRGEVEPLLGTLARVQAQVGFCVPPQVPPLNRAVRGESILPPLWPAPPTSSSTSKPSSTGSSTRVPANVAAVPRLPPGKRDADATPADCWLEAWRGEAVAGQAATLTWPTGSVSAHYVARCPRLAGRTIIPNVLHHTAAMRLLHNGVGITVIARWLVHESVATTQIGVPGRGGAWRPPIVGVGHTGRWKTTIAGAKSGARMTSRRRVCSPCWG